MKTIPAALLTHVAGNGATSLAFGIRLVLRDETVLAWTQAHEDATVTVDGESTLLVSNPGFTVKSLVSTAGLSVDTSELTIVDGDDITRADILARRWDGASVYMFRYNIKSPSDGIIPVKRGSFGNFRPKLGHFEVEFRDIRQAFQANSTWVFQEGCRWRFGDLRCGIDAAALTVTATVSGLDSQRAFAADSLTQASDYFGEGVLVWTDGDNAGTEQKVRTFADGFIELSDAAIFDIQAGDEFEITPGCRKRWDPDCFSKWNNLRRYGGEPDKPTRDGWVSAGRQAELPQGVDPTPAPAPSPPPVPAPPPSAPTSRPLIVGLDYTQTYDAGNVTLHAKFDLSIRSFSTSQAAANGASWPTAVLAANPDWELANYFIINELAPSLPTNHDYYPLLQRANAQSAWVLDEPEGSHVQWTTAYGKDEINITSALPSLSGKTYLQWKVEEWDFPTRLDEIPDATHAFIDNYWHRPRVEADYDRNGTNETRDGAAAAFRAGLVYYGEQLQAGRPGLKLIGNSAGSDLSSFDSELNIAFDEGTVGKSYGQFATGGITAVRTRMLSLIANTADGVAILNCYGESTNYARHRFAYAMAALFDAGICCIDETPTLNPVHIDEFYVDTGARVGAIPSAATENGIWSVEYEGALFLCNPTSSSASIDVTAIGGGLWKRINAASYDNQDPTTNSGANVSSVTLAAQTGLLLVPQ